MKFNLKNEPVQDQSAPVTESGYWEEDPDTVTREIQFIPNIQKKKKQPESDPANAANQGEPSTSGSDPDPVGKPLKGFKIPKTDLTETWLTLCRIDPSRFLDPDRSGGWICPICGSGSGKNGTGLALTGSDEYPLYMCWPCHKLRDAIELYGLKRGIIEDINHPGKEKVHAAEKMAEEYGFQWDQSGKLDWEIIDEKRNTSQSLVSSKRTTHKEYQKNENKRDFSNSYSNWNQNLYNAYSSNEAHPGKDFLLSRQIGKEIVKRFNLGFNPDYEAYSDSYTSSTGIPVIVIPISENNCFLRVLPEYVEEAGGKYLKIPGTHQELFNTKVLEDPSVKFIFITEGAFDALTIEQYGFKAMGMPSAQAGIRELERVLHEFLPIDKTFILCMDSDSAGKEGATHVAEILERAGYKYYQPEGLLGRYKDANEAAINDSDGFVSRLTAARKEAEKIPNPNEKTETEKPIPDGMISDTERYAYLTGEMAKLKAVGLDLATIKATLEILNREKCYPPLSKTDIETSIINKYTRIAAKIPKNLNAIGEAAYQMEKAEKLEFLSGRELQEKYFAPREWLIENIIPSGGLVMLCADPKSYKSWMCLDMGNSIADGKPFMSNGQTFEGFRTSRGKVLYFDLEADTQSGHERLEAMNYDGMSPASEDLLYLANPQDTQTFGTGLEKQLLEALEAHPDTKMVILDTLQMVKGSTGKKAQNAYERDVEELKQIRDFAYLNHITILVVHHTNKMGQGSNVFNSISGSNGMYGTVTTALLLKQTDGAGELYVNGKTGKSENYKIHFDKTKYRWVCDGTLSEYKHQTETEETEGHPLYEAICQLSEQRTVNKYGISAQDILNHARNFVEMEIDMDARAVGKWISNHKDAISASGIQTTSKTLNGRKYWLFAKAPWFKPKPLEAESTPHPSGE